MDSNQTMKLNLNIHILYQNMDIFKIPIYCLSFINSERRRRMEDRFNQLDLSSNYYFQDALDINNPLLDFYLRKRPEGRNEHGRRLASMTIGYLSMIKKFLSTGQSYGVFCEDDIHIRKTFKQDIISIIQAVESIKPEKKGSEKVKKKPKIILLGYLSIIKPEFQLYDETIKLINGKYRLMEYPEDIWGAQMILLSRKNAMKIIEKYDRPFHLSFPNGKSYSGDCSFTKLEPRALIWPMLGVEEGSVETKDIGQIQFHKLCHQVNFNKEDYI